MKADESKKLRDEDIRGTESMAKIIQTDKGLEMFAGVMFVWLISKKRSKRLMRIL